MNEQDKKALMTAVVSGRTLAEVEGAFKKHFKKNDRNYFDYELLKAALKRKNFFICKYLITKTSCRVNCQQRIEAEEIPLHLAMKLKHNAVIIQELVKKGALVFAKDTNGDTPMLAAYKNKNMDAVKQLLTHSKPKCNPEDEDAMINFHIACVMNHNAVTHYLKCGLNPNVSLNLKLGLNEYAGYSLLHFAVKRHYTQLLQVLVSHGGDVSTKNAAGLTPLHCMYYSYDTILLKKVVNRVFECFRSLDKFVNVVDSNGVSHFHLSCMINEPDFVQQFMNNGADVHSPVSLNSKKDPGFTPLHFAAINGCERVVALLLKNGANSNKTDKDGRTPLHLACRLPKDNNKIFIVTKLLDYKADQR